MFALLRKGWHWCTGIALVTGIILVNVLKGQRNALKCAFLSKEPITILFPYHDYYPPMAWEPRNVGKVGGCRVLVWRGSLPVCLLCSGLKTAAPTRLFPTGKYRHLQKLFFSLQKFDHRFEMNRTLNKSLQCLEVCGRRHVCSAASPPCKSHCAEFLKPSRAQALSLWCNSNTLAGFTRMLFFSSLQPHFSSSKNMLQPYYTICWFPVCYLLFLHQASVEYSHTVNSSISSSAAFSPLTCSPLLSILLGCQLAYSSFEYQPRCHLSYKAFPDLKSEVNALPEHVLKAPTVFPRK